MLIPRKPTLALGLLLAVSACSAPRHIDDVGKVESHRMDKIGLGLGDAADAGTTAIGLWTNAAEEINPILAPAGAAAPVVVLPLKYGAKKALHAAGTTAARANYSVDTAGALAACSNVAVLAGTALPPALAFGAACYMAYGQYLRDQYELDTGHTLDGKPVSFEVDDEGMVTGRRVDASGARRKAP